MPIFARTMFGLVKWAARKGLVGFVRAGDWRPPSRRRAEPAFAAKLTRTGIFAEMVTP